MRDNGASCRFCKHCTCNGEDLMCMNGMSDMFADYVDADLVCEEFEGNEEEDD